MTKQDFEFFVEYLVRHNLKNSAVTELIELFEKRNKRFCQSKFYEALGKARNKQQLWVGN